MLASSQRHYQSAHSKFNSHRTFENFTLHFECLIFHITKTGMSCILIHINATYTTAYYYCVLLLRISLILCSSTAYYYYVLLLDTLGVICNIHTYER